MDEPCEESQAASEALADELGMNVRKHYRLLRASVCTVGRTADAAQAYVRAPGAVCADERRALLACYQRGQGLECHQLVQGFMQCVRDKATLGLED